MYYSLGFVFSISVKYNSVFNHSPVTKYINKGQKGQKGHNLALWGHRTPRGGSFTSTHEHDFTKIEAVTLLSQMSPTYITYY